MPDTTKQQHQQESNKPVRVFRLRGVKISVFENRGANGVFFKVAMQRIFRDGDEWKTTPSLNRDDVPVARHLLEKAWEFILESETNRTKESECTHGGSESGLC